MNEHIIELKPVILGIELIFLFLIRLVSSGEQWTSFPGNVVKIHLLIPSSFIHLFNSCFLKYTYY